MIADLEKNLHTPFSTWNNVVKSICDEWEGEWVDGCGVCTHCTKIYFLSLLNIESNTKNYTKMSLHNSQR